MASEAQIQRQLLAQQRAKFARAAKDRENRERQSWEMKQEGGRRSVSRPAKASKYTPNNNRPSVGRRMGFQVLDDIVPLADEMFVSTPIAPIPDRYVFGFLNAAVDQVMLTAGATATNATPQAQNENIAASSVAQACEQTRKLFLSEVSKWNSPAPPKRFNPSSGLVETRVAGQLTKLENQGRDVASVKFSNGGEFTLQPGESFTVAAEYGRIEIVTPMQRESAGWSISEVGTYGGNFPTYGGISRNSQSRPYPRRSEGREDLEELERFYRNEIAQLEARYQRRVQDLESALLRMQRQLSDAMALQNRPIMMMDPMTGEPREVRRVKPADPKPSPAEIYLKNPPRKFRHSIKD